MLTRSLERIFNPKRYTGNEYLYMEFVLTSATLKKKILQCMRKLNKCLFEAADSNCHCDHYCQPFNRILEFHKLINKYICKYI